MESCVGPAGPDYGSSVSPPGVTGTVWPSTATSSPRYDATSAERSCNSSAVPVSTTFPPPARARWHTAERHHGVLLDEQDGVRLRHWRSAANTAFTTMGASRATARRGAAAAGGHERPADGDHLLLAARQRPALAVAELAQRGEQVVDVVERVAVVAARVGPWCRPGGSRGRSASGRRGGPRARGSGRACGRRLGAELGELLALEADRAAVAARARWRPAGSRSCRRRWGRAARRPRRSFDGEVDAADGLHGAVADLEARDLEHVRPPDPVRRRCAVDERSVGARSAPSSHSSSSSATPR